MTRYTSDQNRSVSQAIRTTPFGDTLLIGAGPAAIHVAVQLSRGWSSKLGLLNREGPHAARLLHDLEKSQQCVSSRVHGEEYQHLEGTVRLHRFYAGYTSLEVDGSWKTIIICTPCDSYRDVIRQLQLERLPFVHTIVLLSPSFGSNLLVTSELPLVRSIDVISLSTYFAATKFDSASMTTSYTKAMKKKIYAASNQSSSWSIEPLQRFISGLGIQCDIVSNPLEAESRSITMYVHPPLFINEFSLDQILSHEPSKKSMYKLYPEGPITSQVIHVMVELWREISRFLISCGSKPINLLQFMNDDNYPVREENLSRYEIEHFVELEPIHQEYLLYIRYSSLLIDPFSSTDEQGKYFDFSAVPYKQVYQDECGRWLIPRIPFEDYKRLKVLSRMAELMDVNMPQTLQLIQLFEQRLQQFMAEKGASAIHPDMFNDRAMEEADVIYRAWECAT
ncbi:opine metallophore biosynthesis dehydrogenase [Paenibacillus sp. SC116]|uniref:opine metallophore biosynthesis dehydrogenase n=1 Tax=Paenibacillus sp. SC116 TaxID=2968986 RepID=UPI00215AAE8F|nr:opine metallophore biosynthesis dehydrogenase [Paenibacillus sp. SC116]MCR8842700.1 opine metallophore biosynthesis dehydrogenase [Paenibacillus sp. SC116]